MKLIPDNAVPCTCGKGYIVDCADGTVGCTATITKFEAVYGSWGVEYTVRVANQSPDSSRGME